MRCHAFVLVGWIAHDLFFSIGADPTGSEERWLGGCGSVLRTAVHLLHFSVALRVAVSKVRVFLLREICQGLRLCAEGQPLRVLV